jgi:hypothetical protein
MKISRRARGGLVIPLIILIQMNSSPARVAAVAGGLLFAGAVFGGSAGGLSALIALRLLPATEFYGGLSIRFPAFIGATLGAVLLPASSFLLLRRVPLGVSWIGVTLGAMLGGLAG